MAWSDVDWMPASCAAGPLDIGRRSLRLWPNPGQGGGLASASDRRLSATLQSEADPTIENEATGSWLQSAVSWVLMLGRVSIPRLRSR